MIAMKKLKGDEKQIWWSQLPTLVIWMIKDRLLTFIDVFRLSLVCKDWKAASESYPFKSQHQRLQPWLMLRPCNTRIPDSKCDFLNLSTQEKLVLDLPEMRKNELLHSRQGWVLFRQGFRSGPPPDRPAILLHLYTNTKIVMPDPGDFVWGYVACFSSSADGTPEVVVFDATRGTCKAFCVATVGDNNWIKHSYDAGRRINTGHTSLVVVKRKIYSMEQAGSLCIFDMSNLVWTEIVANPGGYSRIMETNEGEIVRIHHIRNCFKFSKLNESTMDWEVLNNSDMESMSWFISVRRNIQFAVRKTGKMKNVYYACIDPGKRNRTSFMLNIYDLLDGSTKSYKPDKDIQWVDLGALVKVPPSCIGYEPPSHSVTGCNGGGLFH